MGKKLKTVCISDCHGNLSFKVPKSDLLLIAGDMEPARHNPYLSVPMQRMWLENNFRQWLDEQPVKYTIFISGNHSWIWEVAKCEVPAWIPKTTCDLDICRPNKIVYLEDDWIDYKGLKIYGTPVQLPFNNWAFNRSEEVIQRHWDKIPEGLDILLLHSPPYGILDKTHHPNYPPKRIGSESLKKRIDEIKPKYVVFGHNHSEHGIVEQDGITFVNCSLLDEEYKMVNKPIVLEI